MLYFMRATDETGPVKIGVSGNLDVRRQSLTKMVGKEMTVLAAVDAEPVDEAIVHRSFNHILFRGRMPFEGRELFNGREWFEPAPELLDYISKVASTGTLPFDQQRPSNEIMSARKALKMTQARFAKALGMSQSAISKMENGALKIDRRTSLAIDALKAKHKEGRV